MSRTENTTRNIIWGWLKTIINMGLPFVTRTVMIYTLGMEYIGLGSLFSSVLQVLSFAELGIGGAMTFSMYKPMAEHDEAKVSALLNLYRKTYRIIGIIIMIAGLGIMPFLHFFIAGDLPSGVNLYVLFAVYLFNNFIGYFLFAYKESLFNAAQRVDIISKVGMGLQLLLNVLQIIILLTIRNYYVYVMVIPIITVLNNIFVGIVADKAFPQYKCEGQIDLLEKKTIEKKVKGILWQKIGNIILESADTIVISSFLGLKILGVYNGYYCIITVLFGLLSVLQQSMVPSIGNSVVTEKLNKNLSDFKIFQFIYLWIVSWWCACLLGLYQPFILIWQGKDNILPDIDVILLVVYFFISKMGDICWIYREAKGLWWEARFVPIVSSIFNLITNILLVQYIGLPGILLSSIFARIFINFPWASKVLFDTYFQSRIEWCGYMVKTCIYAIIMIVASTVTWKICEFVPCSGILNLMIRGFICLVLPNIILFFLRFRNPEFIPAGKFVLRLIPQRIVPGFARRYFAD